VHGRIHILPIGQNVLQQWPGKGGTQLLLWNLLVERDVEEAMELLAEWFVIREKQHQYECFEGPGGFRT